MRIIGGTAKGHAIKAPKGLDTRPTLDRVRESVFNVLANRGIVGSDILDIFSDPPYENGFIQDTIDLVVNYDLLKPEGVLLLEHHKDEVFTLPESWECIKEQKFGYTVVSYFVKTAERS